MDKKNTVSNLANFYNEVYHLIINDVAVPEELQMEMDFGGVDYALDESLDSWVKALNFYDQINTKIVKLAKEKPELYEKCRIVNRKLTMLMDGMEKVMIKDLNVTGFIRNNGRLEVVL